MLLRLDHEYRNLNNWKDERDEFNKIFKRFIDNKGIQNGGGFRFKSKYGNDTSIENAAFVLLVTDFSQHEWPDKLELDSGIFTYYGDNREVGDLLSKQGNRLLNSVFDKVHTFNRGAVPPFLIFQKLKKTDGSYMKFLGLAAPGGEGFSASEDLVAVWGAENLVRFPNYRGIFSVLKEDVVDLRWLDQLCEGIPPAESDFAPTSWRTWVVNNKYNILQCEVKKRPRTKSEQIPLFAEDVDILTKLKDLSDREFEYAAKEILQMLDNNLFNLSVTRRVKDGGYDIFGSYMIGSPPFNYNLEIVAEAKKWDKNSIRVTPIARLISRLKHKDVGFFLTTSYFDKQVQEELIEDKHAIILLAGVDLINILKDKQIAGKGKDKEFASWLNKVRYEASNKTDY